jgi:hypothetical protein
VTNNKNFTILADAVYAICWQNNLSVPNLTSIKLKINQCYLDKNSSRTNKQKEYYTLDGGYQLELNLELAQDFLAFICIPIACIIGFLLNLRVILTIKTNNKVELKEDFYKYMSLNSKFNCLYCLIYVFYPINYCLTNVSSGLFCSPVFNTVAAQLYKLVFMTYFGEAVKMCSNISYIFISISRYMLIGKEHSLILESISKVKIKKLILLAVIFSALMNIGHCFQFKINYGWGFMLENYFYVTAPDAYPVIVLTNYSLTIYFLVYFLINFVVFLVINTVVEASLVRKIHEEIAEKRKKTEEEIKNTSLNNSAQSQVVNNVLKAKQKKIEQDAKKETRAIIMVISNSLINFILRLPEIFVYVLSSKILDTNFTKIPIFSILMVSSSYLAYILTFTTNVAIFYFFNIKFKQQFVFWNSFVKQK